MDLPDNVESIGRSPEFDVETVPAALRSQHALAEGRWARLTVLAGNMRFVDLRTGQVTALAAGKSAVVPPRLPHRVELGQGARFQLEFFKEPGSTH